MRTARRAIQAVTILGRDRKIPRPLRWLAVFGLLPVPGPFDEAVLLIVAGLLFTFYPDRMREAWRTSARRSIQLAESAQAAVARTSGASMCSPAGDELAVPAKQCL